MRKRCVTLSTLAAPALILILVLLSTAAFAEELPQESGGREADPAPASLEITADAGTSWAVPEAAGPDTPGETNITLRAEAKDAGENALTGLPVSWTCVPEGSAPAFALAEGPESGTAVVTLTSGFAAHAKAEIYTYTVKAACGGMEAELKVKIYWNAAKASFVGEIIGPDYIKPGRSAEYRAAVYDQYGREMKNTQPYWHTSSESLANVTQYGSVTAEKSGQGQTFTLGADPSRTEDANAQSKEIYIGNNPQPCRIIGLDPSNPTNMFGDVEIPYGVPTAPKFITEPADARVTFTVLSTSGDISLQDGGTMLKGTKAGSSVRVAATAHAYGFDDSKAYEFYVEVVRKPLTEDMIEDIPDVTYNGSTYVPTVVVRNGSLLLKKDTHYTISTSGAMIGEGSVTIFGVSPYCGSATKSFTVNRAEITDHPELETSVEYRASQYPNQGRLEGVACMPKTASWPGPLGGSVAVELQWKMTSGVFDPKGGRYEYEAEVSAGPYYVYTGPRITRTVTVIPVRGEISLSSASASASLEDVKAHQSDLSGIQGIPSKVTIDYGGYDSADDPRELPITGWTEEVPGSLAAALEAMERDPSRLSDPIVLLPVFDRSRIPVWATTGEVPAFSLTISGKKVPTFTYSGKIPSEKIYDGVLLQFPTATPKDENGETLRGGKGSILYTSDLTGESSTRAPKDAGAYTVTVSYQDDAYHGQEQFHVLIRPRPLGIVWGGVSGLSYDGTPKRVTAAPASADLAEGDVCIITVENGTQTNAGTYTARALLDNPNYTLRTDTETRSYTIAKARRTLTAQPGSILLTPGASTHTAPLTADGDDGARALLSVSGDVSAVTWNRDTGEIAAVGNGTASVRVTMEETANYRAPNPVEITVRAYAEPLISVGAVSAEGDPDARLSACFDGDQIRISGLLAADAEVTGVTASLADGLQGTYLRESETYEIKTTGGEPVAVYRVDTGGVVRSGVTPVEGEASGAVSDSIPENLREQVRAAVESSGNRLEGVIPSAAAGLLREAERLMEEAQAAGRAVEAEVSLRLEARDLQLPGRGSRNTYTVDVRPQYRVVLKTEGGAGIDSVLREGTELPNAWLTTPVTVTAVLPGGLESIISRDLGSGIRLYARHTKRDGAVEYLETNLKYAEDGLTASWQMSSFSEVELYTAAYRSVTVRFEDDVTTTRTYTETDRGQALPPASTGLPWLINGKEYTEAAELLDDSGISGSVTAVPKPRPASRLDVDAASEAGGLRLRITAVNPGSAVLHGTLYAALYGVDGRLQDLRTGAVSAPAEGTAGQEFLFERYSGDGRVKVFWADSGQYRPAAPAWSSAEP